MKIKIINKEEIIEGKITKGIVKPTGTSAHIPFSKQHTAKHVKVVIPTDVIYSWIFSDIELKQFVSESKKIIKKEGGKLTFYKLESLKRIENSNFKLEDLIRICSLLTKNKKLINLVQKIRNTIKLD
jgi:putative transposon-encoded protein